MSVNASTRPHQRATRHLRASFRSIGTRNFRLYMTGHLVSQVGNWSRMVAQSLLVLSLTDSGLALGALAACQFGPLVLLGAWTGVIVDRFDKQVLLRIVQLLTSVASFSLAILTALGDPPLAAIYALALVGGIGHAFENPTRRALVSELVPPDQVHNAVSLNTAATTLSQVLGPLTAGLLITTVGYAWCFVFDGCSYIFMAVLLLRIDKRAHYVAPRHPRAPGQIRAGLRYIRSVPELHTALLMLFVVSSVAYNNMSVILPLFVTQSLDGSDMGYTLLYSMLSVGSLISVVLVAGQAAVSIRQVNIAAIALAFALFLLAIMPTMGMAMASAILVGAAAFGFFASANSVIQVRTDAAMRGRVLALQAIVVVGGTPICGPIIGTIADAFGPRSALAVGAATCACAALYGLRTRNRRMSALTDSVPTMSNAPLEHDHADHGG